MGLSGLVGAGAAKGLEAVLAEQLERELFEEQRRQALAQEAMAGRRMDQGDAQMAQEGAQFGEQMDFRRQRATAEDALAGEEMQQQGIADMRGQQERQRVNLTRLQDEADVEGVMGDADPVARRVITLRRAGVNAPRGDVMTAGERQSELDAETNADIRRDRARQQAERDFSERAGAGGQPAVASAYTSERNARTMSAAKALRDKVSGWTTGAGSLLSALPATDATDFAAELNTLKSNIAFNELAEMRAASKTGGALGAVSEKEMALLESALGALNPRQSSEQFRAQLDQIIGSLERFSNASALSTVPGNNSSPMTEIEYVRGPNGRLVPRGGG
jgi:hypothetical protein